MTVNSSIGMDTSTRNEGGCPISTKNEVPVLGDMPAHLITSLTVAMSWNSSELGSSIDDIALDWSNLNDKAT